MILFHWMGNASHFYFNATIILFHNKNMFLISFISGFFLFEESYPDCNIPKSHHQCEGFLRCCHICHICISVLVLSFLKLIVFTKNFIVSFCMFTCGAFFWSFFPFMNIPAVSTFPFNISRFFEYFFVFYIF